MDCQQTLAKPFLVSGVGLHTGLNVKLRITPAPANTGIVFKRTDLEGFAIQAHARNVARVSYATSLMKKGVLISTVEHLLSALSASGVDNAQVEIDNLEVPILDGSALPFARLVAQAGLRRQRARRLYAKILKPVEVTDGPKRLAIYPSEQLQVTYRIRFAHPLIGEQSVEFSPDRGNYQAEIAPARTFGFIEEVETLRQSGLIRGGSLANAVVLTGQGVMNSEGLRFPDEFCRHKILDILGDISLFGHRMVGHIVAECAGHAMHLALVTRLLREKGAWELVTSEILHAKPARAEVPEVAVATRLS